MPLDCTYRALFGKCEPELLVRDELAEVRAAWRKYVEAYSKVAAECLDCGQLDGHHPDCTIPRLLEAK